MASKNVSFEKIGSSIRKPGVYAEFNTRMAVRSLPGNLQRTLLVGQKTADSTGATLQVTDVFSDDQAATQFGIGSQLHRMVLAALTANPYAQLSVVALDDPAGSVAAVWKLTITGAPTDAGTLYLGLAGDTIAVNVNATDTPTTVAAAFVAAIAAKPKLPFTAANVAGVLSVTAKNKGALANATKVTVTGAVAGLAAALAVGTAGASDPDISGALNAAFLGGHNNVAIAYRDTTSVRALRTYLQAVGSYAEKRWAIGSIASNGSLGDATTVSSAINDGFISNPWCRGTPTSTTEIAAAYAATIAATEDPALPFNDVEVAGIVPPAVADQTSRTEQESALYNGVTPLYVGPGGKVQIVRAVTTYTVNASNVPDIALLDVTTPRTMMYVAKAFVEDRGRRYSRAKITPRLIKSMHDTGKVLLYKLEDLEIIEAVDDNIDDYIVERDEQDPNRINERIPVDVVNGLHVIAERFDLLL